MAVDVEVINHGTIVSFIPLTPDGRGWIQQLQTEPWQWLGNSLNVDHRNAGNIVEAMVEDGLEVA